MCVDNRGAPDDPYHRLEPVNTCLYVRVRETSDWDLFPFLKILECVF